ASLVSRASAPALCPLSLHDALPISLQRRSADGRVQRVMEAGGPEGFPENNALRQMSRGPDGALWLATRVGLLMWNAGVRRFEPVDRKSTRLNSSHVKISYAVFCSNK